MKQWSVGKNGEQPQLAPFRFRYNYESPRVLSGRLDETCQFFKANVG